MYAKERKTENKSERKRVRVQSNKQNTGSPMKDYK